VSCGLLHSTCAMPKTALHHLQALLFAIALLGAGCSSFNHDWRKAANNPTSALDLQGRWEGRWISEADRHDGKLRCLVTRNADNLYQARFHAKYKKILSFAYTVLLTTERTDGTFKFHGDADLGWLAGGIYHYEGHADATNFFSTYSSKYDHGTFQMQRPSE